MRQAGKEAHAVGGGRGHSGGRHTHSGGTHSHHDPSVSAWAEGEEMTKGAMLASLSLLSSPPLLRFSSPPLLLSTSTPVLLSFSPPPSLLLPCSPPLLLVSSPTLLHSTFNLCRSRPPSSRALSVSCFPLRWAIASRHCARLRSRGPKHPSGTLCWKPPCPKRSRRQVCACTRTSPLCELELCDSCFCVVEEV